MVVSTSRGAWSANGRIRNSVRLEAQRATLLTCTVDASRRSVPGAFWRRGGMGFNPPPVALAPERPKSSLGRAMRCALAERCLSHRLDGAIPVRNLRGRRPRAADAARRQGADRARPPGAGAERRLQRDRRGRARGALPAVGGGAVARGPL